MIKFPWWVAPAGSSPSDGPLFNENKGGPWGAPGGGRGSGGGGGEGPRNPWSQPPRKRPTPGGNVTSLDDFLKKSRERFGGGGTGGGTGLPSLGGKPMIGYLAAALVVLWLLFTAIHRIGPQERGVITRFGQYAGTLSPGMQFSFPAPIDNVEKIDVEGIRTIDVGSVGASGGENLMLTGDQNIIDLAYSVRWNIADPELYMFQLADPDKTIREVAESAMRAVVARVSLDDAIGAQRSRIEQDVEQLMQQILTRYRAGVVIQGIAIRQADPPAAVNQAFKEVSAAQQDAQSYMNQARAYALQLTAKAQGEAAQFDKVYEQYRQAPEVTRRRMYYETMEQVLSKVDKTVVETGNVTPYLALPEVQRRQQPQAQAQAPAEAGAAR
ncbi:MAG TPA: FtsH protease activity modulator HflK [Sphingomonadaceae bacterium]|nr:FtsH protease activity modulator HflK [Sphingomonadaceae bacterium]